MFGFLSRQSLGHGLSQILSLMLLVGLQVTPVLAQAQEAGLVFKKSNLQAGPDGQPKDKGELSCFEIDLTPKKTICRYLPINEQAINLQTGILRIFFGGRQPSNPDEAYVRVLNNGQLEFSHTDSLYVQKIIETLPSIDTLDVYVERRKVNIVVQILQLLEGADSSAGFLLGAQYSGHGRESVTEKDRLVTTTTGSLINLNFAFGNLVNTLLDVTLSNYKANNNIKVISSVPLQITHGYQLSNVTPYTKPIYVQTTSVSSVPEEEGIRFEGQARFHENVNKKILIKDFSISVSQYEPNTVKKEGVVEGVETFKSPVRDLELEIGCSTAIRVINVARKVKRKEKNLFSSSKNREEDSKKVFLFVIQAVSDSKGSEPSTHCAETGAVPEIPDQK